jgi:hypothetical protein
MTTLETRGESHEQVDKQKRYSQIIECLKECPKMTAKEVAVMMMQKGYIPTSERNFTAPRLTEMCQKGIVEPIGKTVCQYTGKTVAVYSLRIGQMNIFDI